MLGTPCATGTWLFGLEAEERIREAWIPLISGREYIGHGVLKKFLAELRLTDVCLIGGQVTVAELDQISTELGRRPAIVYGFNPTDGRWTSLRVQRAEIGTRFAIFGTSLSTETTRQLEVIRFQKYCFWDDRRGLGQAGAAYASRFFPPPKRSAHDKKQSARSNAQMSSEALWDEEGDGMKNWVEEVMNKKDYERTLRRNEAMEEVAPDDWAPGNSLRHEWFKAQRLDPKFTVLIEKPG